MTRTYVRPEGILKGTGSESRLNAAQLYDHIHREYLLTGKPAHAGDNPHKIGIELSAEGPSMTSFFNVMGARLSSGYFGSKSIYCDMRDGRQIAKTLLFDRNGWFVWARASSLEPSSSTQSTPVLEVEAKPSLIYRLGGRRIAGPPAARIRLGIKGRAFPWRYLPFMSLARLS